MHLGRAPRALPDPARRDDPRRRLLAAGGCDGGPSTRPRRAAQRIRPLARESPRRVSPQGPGARRQFPVDDPLARGARALAQPALVAVRLAPGLAAGGSMGPAGVADRRRNVARFALQVRLLEPGKLLPGGPGRVLAGGGDAVAAGLRDRLVPGPQRRRLGRFLGLGLWPKRALLGQGRVPGRGARSPTGSTGQLLRSAEVLTPRRRVDVGAAKAVDPSAPSRFAGFPNSFNE